MGGGGEGGRVKDRVQLKGRGKWGRKMVEWERGGGRKYWQIEVATVDRMKKQKMSFQHAKKK